MDNATSNWTGRIVASFAMIAAVAAGLWLFTREAPAREKYAVIATSCSKFEVDARTLFDKGDIAILRGKFAPGDHVHLALDLKGVGYVWDVMGVLAKKPEMTGYGAHVAITGSNATSTVAHGKVSGFARLEWDIDVDKPGDGVIMISRIDSVPLMPASVASASCRGSKTMHVRPSLVEAENRFKAEAD